MTVNHIKLISFNHLYIYYLSMLHNQILQRGPPGWLNELGLYKLLGNPTAYHQYGVGSRPALLITKRGALHSQPQVIKVYQLLAQGRWFSLSTPVSSTTKTGCHDIAEILLKVALKHQKSNQINLVLNR